MKTKKPVVKLRWLRFTEEMNALDFLKRAHHFIGQIDSDDAAWKWVIISLYGALYGFAICACKGTDPDNVTYDTKKGKRLISFNKAMRRCQDPSRRQMSLCCKHLAVTPAQQKSIDRLQEDFRHKFEHHIPAGWSIEIHGMPDICLDVIEVIRALVFDTGIFLHLDTRERSKLKSYLVQSKRMLKKSCVYRELRAIERNKATVYNRRSRSKSLRLIEQALEHDLEQQGVPQAAPSEV
jgi:hypothetical protein